MAKAFRTFDGEILREWEFSGEELGVTREHDVFEADVLRVNERARNEEVYSDLSFGRLAASIPPGVYRRLQRTHPDLFCPDAEVSSRAWRRWLLSEESLPYRVVRKV